jgi:radical SAM superfamily enzyme YgiQ (UPF0313 family)
MRIVLLSTPTRVYTPNYIVPTGIISLAAYLEKCGHDVRVVDAAALREPNERIVRRVQEFDPQLVGVGGIITAYGYIISLTQDLRRAMPRMPIVLGGQVAINNVDNCFRHMAIDYVVHGYGEIAMEKIARHVQGSLPREAIPGISYVEGGEIINNEGREFYKNINDMPLPAYHLIDMEHYATVNGARHAKLQKYLDKTGQTAKSHRFTTVMGTLGCTDRCTFCVHEQEYVGLKVFSNEYLLNHIRHLRDTYDIHVFSIGEEMFITKLNRAREFNGLMNQHFPDVFWSASTRADFVTPEMIAELETGNCYTLAWGFESGSQRMLDMMKKRMTREQNMLAYSCTDKSKLVSACSLMVGNVGEDNQSIKETVDAIRTSGIGRSAVFFASAYPGGRTWDWAVERGIIKDTHAYLMAASDKDAGVRINVNLTPFPDFILKAWQQMLMWECDKQERLKHDQLFSHQPFIMRMRKFARYLLGYTYIPTPIVRYLVEAYFLYYRITRRFFKMPRDRQYEYKTDKKGSILPEKLVVGRAQTYMSPEQIDALMARPKVRIPLKVLS